MKKLLLILSLFLTFLDKTPLYSYGGPTVNDRNVVPVFTPKFYKPNWLKIPKEVNLKNLVLRDIIIKKEGVKISENLVNSYAWRKLSKGKIVDENELKQNLKNINRIGSNNQRTNSNSIGADYDRTKHETKFLLSFTQSF